MVEKEPHALATVLDELDYLTFNKIKRKQIYKCRHLATKIWNALQVDPSNLQNVQRQETVLRAVLRAVAMHALALAQKQDLNDEGRADRSTNPVFQSLAAAELLGIEDLDGEIFTRLLSKLARRLGASFEESEFRVDKESARRRQLRAGLWIDKGPRSVRGDHRKTLLEAFEAALDKFLGDDHDAALAVVREVLGDDVVPTQVPTTDESSGTAVLVLEQPIEGYIHRPSIEQQISDLIKNGARLVALVGFAGMGKTSVAHAVSAGCPFIEFHGGQPLSIHLHGAIRNFYPELATMTGDPMALLAAILYAKQRAPLVVLDNLQSTDELRSLVPRDTSAVVLATCRESGSNPPPWCNEIAVDVMTGNEAVQLVEALVPGLPRKSAEYVAVTLDRYPLAIEVACRLAQETSLSVTELCRDLASSPDDIAASTNDKLRDILTRSVESLIEDHPLSVLLLAYLASNAEGFRGREVTTLRELVDFICPDEFDSVQFATSLQKLQKLALIRFELYPLVAAFKKDPTVNQRLVQLMKQYYVTSHPLINTVLSSILEEAIRIVDTELYLLLDDALRKATDAFDEDQRGFFDEVDLQERISRLSYLFTRNSRPIELDDTASSEDKHRASQMERRTPLYALDYMLDESYIRSDGDDRDIRLIVALRNLDLHAEELAELDAWIQAGEVSSAYSSEAGEELNRESK